MIESINGFFSRISKTVSRKIRISISSNFLSFSQIFHVSTCDLCDKSLSTKTCLELLFDAYQKYISSYFFRSVSLEQF